MDENTGTEYPYSLRVIGYAAEDFENIVLSIFDKHGISVEGSESSVRHSRAGKYTSLRVQFTLEGRSQLEAVYTDLKNNERIVFVL